MGSHMNKVLMSIGLGLSSFTEAYSAEGADSSALQAELLSPSSIGTSIWQMGLGLILVLLVIFALAWLMKRVTGIQGVKSHIKVISAVNVGAKERAVLVEVAGEQLLLGVTSGQVNLLYKLDKPIIEPSVDFSNSLKKASLKLSQRSAMPEKENSR